MTDDLHSQAYLYVVGALDPDEVAEYEAHLSECADCQKEVADMREVTAQLSEVVAAEPPTALRASVLARIAETPQETASPAAADQGETSRTAGRHAAAVPTVTGPAAPQETVQPTDQKETFTAGEDDTSNVVPLRRSWATRASVAVAAAAVIAAAVVSGWAINERNNAQHDAEVAAAQADQLTKVLGAADVQAASAEVTGGGTATVVRSQSEGVALLVAADLPTLESDQVYEAWTIEGDNDPVPAGTFEPEGAHTTFELTQAALEAGAIALSVEPTGGSPAPTTTPIVAVDLSNS